MGYGNCTIELFDERKDMTIREAVKLIRTNMTPKGFKTLKSYAKAGVIRWGEDRHEAGPSDGKGG